MKKNILITQRLVSLTQYHEIRETLDINYAKLINYCGFLPIILPYEVDFKEYFRTIKIDGILFTGGNDLASCNFNELSKKRDTFEKELLHFAIENKIPVFGICRGMQLIAEYFNSSLKPIKNHVNIYHELLVNDPPYLENIKKITKVNAYHNFTIDNLGENLTICATDEEKNIKAISHKQHKIFAQMWHSEREVPFNKDEINLIKEFFND